MNFLGPETDNESESTLQDVLGYIDSYDEAESVRMRTKREPKPNARRTRAQSYRIRDELQRLRREAAQLETRVTQIKNGTDRSYELQLLLLRELNSSASRSKRWIETVLQEYRCREESERTNRQLKALLAKQMHTIRASETAFGMFTDSEISLVFQSQRAMETQNSAMDDLQIMASLGDRLLKLELNVDNVVRSMNTDGSLSSLRCGGSDQRVLLESSVCSPMALSVELAGTWLEQMYAHKVARRKATVLDPNRKDVKISKRKQFQHEQHEYEIVVKGRMRKFHQTDRVVYVRSSLISLPSERLDFIEESIIVICQPSQSSEWDSTASTESGSLLINWHRSHAQHNDAPSTLERNHAVGPLTQTFVSASRDRDRHHLCKLKKWLREGSREAP